MSMNIINCPRCGKIFAKGLKDVCPSCVKEIDNEYDRCVKFLRENKGATSKELSEATDVSVKQITKFIREGRISIYNTPNLGYPCEVCGTSIREGGMCSDCRNRLAKDVSAVNERERIRKEQELALKNAQTYRSID